MTPDRKTATIRRMEPRRVVLVVEAVTDLAAKDLRRAKGLGLYIADCDGVTTCHALLVEQLQVNVVERKPKAKGKLKPKRRRK